MNEYLPPMIILLLIAASRFILPAVRRHIEANVHSKNLDTLLYWASRLVRAAEQKAGLTTNEAKFQYVMNALSRLAGDLGVQMTVQQLEALLEAAVRDMKEPPIVLE